MDVHKNLSRVCDQVQAQGYKTFSCSTQLSTKFILLINVKMPTIVGILTFISMINTTSERLKAINFFICRYFIFNEQLKFCAHHEKSFITSKPVQLQRLGRILKFCNMQVWLSFLLEKEYQWGCCIKKFSWYHYNHKIACLASSNNAYPDIAAKIKAICFYYTCTLSKLS